MTNRKDLIIVALATFCLATALFMIVPTRSQTGSYSARMDVNGDGSIDMADLQAGIDNFMTNGDPTLGVNIESRAVHKWAELKYLDPLSYWVWENRTAGYESVTVLIEMNNFPGENLDVIIWFTIEGDQGDVSFLVERFAMNITLEHVVRTYPVSGDRMGVQIYNNSPGMWCLMNLGIYARA